MTFPFEEQTRGDISLYLLRNYRTGQTIMVPQDMWNRRREMMEKRVLAHMGHFRSIFARKCKVQRIVKPVAAEFLEANHSYGDAACRYRYGLYCGDELVAVAEFSNARRWQKGDAVIRSYEWVRYASLPDVRVVGGMGKVLKAFIDEVHPDDIVSYADLEWSDGSVYRQLGFVEDGFKAPVSFVIDPGTWERVPLKKAAPGTPGLRYVNFGSRKYRLRMKDGQAI
mgnify:CR=1 FL=1